MPLMEHLRELRVRMFRSILAIFVGMVLGYIFYEQIFAVLKQPFESGLQSLLAGGNEVDASLNLVGSPGLAFILQLKTSLVAGIVIASPIWLWQAWAFVVPALRQKERFWSVVFAAISGPLFITGIAVGYWVLPKGLEILIGFTPGGLDNLVSINDYINFVLRMLLVFGIAFEIPLFVVLLNLAGVVTGKQLGSARAWIIIGTFVFAAIGTPSTDPISMLFLAVPMTLLFLISEVIARLVDRRRKRSSGEDFDAYADDEASPLHIDRRPEDERPSSIDDT
ncbi:MAG: twin-arginine translocase subunit TatC [Nocardioidaceae bacterium]